MKTIIYKNNVLGFFETATLVDSQVNTESESFGGLDPDDVLIVDAEPPGDWPERNYTYINGQFVRGEYNLTVVKVPEFVTRRQAVQQLIIEGLDDDVDAAINGIPDPIQMKLMRAWYNESQIFERNRREILLVWQAIGKTQQELDLTFIKASKL